MTGSKNEGATFHVEKCFCRHDEIMPNLQSVRQQLTRFFLATNAACIVCNLVWNIHSATLGDGVCCNDPVPNCRY